MIEVELRCFIDQGLYEDLRERLLASGKLLEDTRQITYYLHHAVDTRIQLSKSGGRVWQKLGKMHDNARREIDVKMSRSDAEMMLEIFRNLDFKLKVSWFRHRMVFDVEGISVSLDNTIGYGRILEVETVTEDQDTSAVEERLLCFLSALGLKPSSKEAFTKAYDEYLASWTQRTAMLSSNWIDES